MMLRSTLSYMKEDCPPPVSPTELVKLKIKMLALTCPEVNDGVTNDEDIYGTIKIGVNDNSKVNVWSKNVDNNVKVKESQIPSDPGAYSMTGVATNFDVECLAKPELMLSKNIKMEIKLTDEECFNRCNKSYETKNLVIPFNDLLKSTTATEGTVIDNFNNAQGIRAFYVDVVENGNSNKIRVWFKVERVN